MRPICTLPIRTWLCLIELFDLCSNYQRPAEKWNQNRLVPFVYIGSSNPLSSSNPTCSPNKGPCASDTNKKTHTHTHTHRHVIPPGHLRWTSTCGHFQGGNEHRHVTKEVFLEFVQDLGQSPRPLGWRSIDAAPPIRRNGLGSGRDG